MNNVQISKNEYNTLFSEMGNGNILLTIPNNPIELVVCEKSLWALKRIAELRGINLKKEKTL
jgi:hypothetical protein